jgi:hypothetical protein
MPMLRSIAVLSVAFLALPGRASGAAPVVSAVAIAASGRGAMTVDFTIADADSDEVRLKVEFSVDGGLEWRKARLPAGAPKRWAATPAGTEHSFEWDALADLGFRGPIEARLRLRPKGRRSADGAVTVDVPAFDRLQAAIERMEFPMVHYGAIDEDTIRIARRHDLVVLHPHGGNLTRDIVRRIQQGPNARDPADDVIVLAYISIGEDLRTVNVSDEEMLLDPRFTGDGTGPRVDPRGPDADGGPLTGLDPLGAPSPASLGYASWYLDDNSVDADPGQVGDGLPDRNAHFGGCFVNAGDPKWFDAVDNMTLDGVDGQAGLHEILTEDCGRGLACDGVFLDTIDTCAPNSYTDPASPNPSEFEWTAAGVRDFIVRLRGAYPGKAVLQNRGLFLFDPRHPHYQVTTRGVVDLVLFESYRLNSNAFEEFDPYFFPDNKFNIAPKLMAEANRPDGFRVISLGYAEGPAGAMDPATLVGQSTAGFDSLMEDIHETVALAGFRHYISDALVWLANDFVLEHADLADTAPPEWTSTYNDNVLPFPQPPGAPTPRVGIQEAKAGSDSITLRWDVALDQNRVGYALYRSETPFDFDGDPALAGYERLVLEPAVGAGYENGVGPGVYAHQASLEGLAPGVAQYLAIRAFDALGNEDQNQSMLSATPYGTIAIAIDGDFADWAALPPSLVDPADAPPSSGPDWTAITLANDATDLFMRAASEDTFNLDGSPGFGFSRTLVFIDADDDPATGYSVGGIGSELLIAGDALYAQEAGVFNAGFLETIAVAPTTDILEWELSVPLARLEEAAPGTDRIRVIFLNDETLDWAPDAGGLGFELLSP